MPTHAAPDLYAQMYSKSSAVVLLERPDSATHARDAVMHEQSSALAIGGRLDDAAQEEPTVGHERAAVFVTV